MNVENRERDQNGTGCLVLSPTGSLDQPAAHRLCTTLQAALRVEPHAVVCDLGKLTGADRAALTALSAVASQATVWPGTGVVVCAPDATLAKRFHHLDNGTVLPVHPTLDQAVAAATGTEPVKADQLPLPPRPAAAAVARAFVRTACADLDKRWTEVATLLTSELVTNAIGHARTQLTVAYSRRPGALRVAVADEDPRLPGPPPFTASLLAEGGRGLQLINALSDAWGARSTMDGGKFVWFLLGTWKPLVPAHGG